jgi:hypothetical protein
MEATIKELNNLLTDYRNDPGSLPTKALEYAIQWFTKGKERSDIGIEGAIKGLQELLDHRGSAADDPQAKALRNAIQCAGTHGPNSLTESICCWMCWPEHPDGVRRSAA